MVYSASLLATAPFTGAGEVLGAVCALLWASAGIVFARIHPRVSASALNLGKNASASLCFLVALWILTGSPLPTGIGPEAFWLLVISGFVGLSLCDTLLLRSLMDIGPQRMSTIFLSVPVLTSLAALLPPFGEQPPAQAWLGMAVALAGIWLVVRDQPVDPSRRGHFSRGVRNAALASILQAAALLLTRRATMLEDVPPLAGATVRMLTGTLGLIVMGVFLGRLRQWGHQLRQRQIASAIFLAAFFGTFLGIWTNQMSLTWSQHTGVAVLLTSLTPIYLIPLSTLFLNERFGRQAWLGTLIAMGGVALMLTQP